MAEPTASTPAEDVRRLRVSLLGALAIAALGSAWILTRATPLTLGGDAEMLQHPLLTDALRQVASGRLPLWTTGRWGGSPLIGDPVIGALYAPYYLSYALTPFPHWRALDVSTCLHLVLLATGMVRLLDRLGAGPVAAVTTAAMTVLSPTFLYAARGWQQYWAALSYWPWLFWAAATLVRTPAVLPALVAAGALAAQVYAGYPEFSLYSGLPALAWIVLAPGGRRRIPLALVVGAGGVALALPQVLPGLQMAHESIRIGPGAAAVMASIDRFFSLSLRNWLDAARATPIAPLAPVKIAPGVVVLAVVGGFGRGFAPRLLAVVALLAGFLATGSNPVYQLVRAFPPFTFFGAPLKLFYPFSFAMLILAGLGLARLDALAVGGRRLVVGLLGVALASLAAGYGLTSIVLLAGTAVIVAAPARLLMPAAAMAALSGSVVFLLLTHALDMPLPFVPPGFIDLMRQPPPVLPRDGGRVLALRSEGALGQVGLNFGPLWGVEAWNGMADLVQRRQAGVLESALPGNATALVRELGGDPVIVADGSPLLAEFTAAGFAPVGRLGRLVYLASQTAPAPRVEIVPHAEAVSAETAVAAARLGTALDDAHVLIEADRLPGGADGDPDGRLEVSARGPGRMRARVALARPSWVVLREPYYANWRATVDGRPVRIYPAAGFLLGILVEAGSHELEVAYREPRLLVGVLLALAGMLALPVGVRRAGAFAGAAS